MLTTLESTDLIAGISILTGQVSTYKSHPKDYFVIRSIELQGK